MLRVLIVDDSATDREILLGNLPERMFRDVEFLEAGTLEHAQRIIDRKDIDVVALDLSLPDSDGFETYFSVRGMVPDVPIVILTGNEDEELAKKLMEHGADSYVLKGTTDPKQVFRIISNAVIRSKHSVRVTEPEADIMKRAQAMSRRVVKSHSSGEMVAVRESATADVLASGIDLQMLILKQVQDIAAKQTRMVSDISGLKVDATRLSGEVKSLHDKDETHEKEIGRASQEFGFFREKMESVGEIVTDVRVEQAALKARHSAIEGLKEKALQHRGKLSATAVALVAALVKGVQQLGKHLGWW